jgi:hypothetical protein
MISQNYQLDNRILKATEVLKLLQSEKGIIEIDKDALVIPIKLDNQQEGYVFHGHGKLLLDTIVETKEGAIGESVEKEINEPFLMLGDTKDVEAHLSEADKENLAAMGYESEQAFMNKAKDLLDQFLNKERASNFHCCCGSTHGFIFAFPNEAGKFDILLARGSNLVYKAINKVFVSHKNKVVLKTPDETIISSERKSIVIKDGHFIKCCH